MDYLVAAFLMIIGIYILFLAMKSTSLECPNRVEYRYVPRTFQEEQADPVKPSVVFASMFEDMPVRTGI